MSIATVTVGVDLGDQWSHYCILGLERETLAEGQLRTMQEDSAEFFQALNAARVWFSRWGHILHGCRNDPLACGSELSYLEIGVGDGN
jgi:hypothetical protein